MAVSNLLVLPYYSSDDSETEPLTRPNQIVYSSWVTTICSIIGSKQE